MPGRTITEDHPKEAGRKPPFEENRQKPPASEQQMRTRPDHGEESYIGSGRLRDRVAVITGADSGIGKAVAIACAREGADVLMGYLPEEEEDARDTAQWIEKAGRKALTMPGDIRDERHCRAMID